jgi:uncharacterized repeat protein (TIGR01451 family)
MSRKRSTHVPSFRSAFAGSSRLAAELLEDRVVPSTLEVPLDPNWDQFGNQFATVQVYHGADGQDRVTFGIFDTGASPVTFSVYDQELFEPQIPVIPGATVEAEGVGGTLSGLVSQPGTIIADGMHAVDLDGLLMGGEFINLSGAASVGGVQAMIGTEEGSPNLPSITGTPILNGRLPGAQTDGVAALIDGMGYELDFGELFPELPEFQGLVLAMPDVYFVEPGRQLVQDPETTTEVARVPVEFLGIDNHEDPGDTLTESYNPIVTGIELTNTINNVERAARGQTFLFDTGAQLSIVSSALAEQLGLDLDNPEYTIDVGGAGGSVMAVPGYTISSLVLPRDDNNDGVIDGELIFTDVPIFVLDLHPGFDGILGMNLFNYAAEMLYDPWDPDGAGPGGPSLQFTFSTGDRYIEDPGDILLLYQLFPWFTGMLGGHGMPNLATNFSPTVAANNAAVAVNEGQTATNTGTFGDADGDAVTTTASVGTVTQNGSTSGTWSWSLPTTDGPGGPVTVTITATDSDGASRTTTFTTTINNVAPTIVVSGNAKAGVGVPYTLQLGAVSDPGTDTVTGYRVNWGDGTSTGFVAGSPTGQVLQHTYTALGSVTITVDLYDEDAAPHAAAATKTITVAEAAPNLKVTFAAPPAFVRGGLAAFTIKVVNLGTVDAAGAFVKFVLPGGLTFLPGRSTTGWERIQPRKFRIDLGTLAPGQQVSVVMRVRVATYLAPGTPLTTTARVFDDGLNGLDPNPNNNVFRVVRRVR